MTAKVTLTLDSADASGAFFTRGSARIVPSFTRLGDTADAVLIEQAGARVVFPATNGPPAVDLYPNDLIGPQGATAPGWYYTIYYDRECPGNPQPWSFQLLSTGGTSQRLSSLAASPVAATVSLYLPLPLTAPSSAADVLGLSSASPLTTAWVSPSAASLPLTTLGDTLAEDGTPAPVRVAGNTTATRKFYRQVGTGTVSALPAWDTVAASDVGAGAFPAYVAPASVALTDAATIAVDAALGNDFHVTLGGNRAMGAPSNPADGQCITFEIAQDATGSRTLTWASGAGGYSFGSSSAPTLSTAASAADLVAFRYSARKAAWLYLGSGLGF